MRLKAIKINVLLDINFTPLTILNKHNLLHNSSLRFEITAKRLYAASQRVL